MNYANNSGTTTLTLSAAERDSLLAMLTAVVDLEGGDTETRESARALIGLTLEAERDHEGAFDVYLSQDEVHKLAALTIVAYLAAEKDSEEEQFALDTSTFMIDVMADGDEQKATLLRLGILNLMLNGPRR